MNIAGARMDRLAISIEPVEITSKDSAGWREYAAVRGITRLTASVSGVALTGALGAAGLGPMAGLVAACDVEILGVSTISGTAHLTAVEYSGEHDGAVEFTAELAITGTVSQTLAPFCTVPPVVTGTATVGSTLTTTNGTWLGDATITLTRDWQRSAAGGGFTSISGATGTTYVIAAGDQGRMLRCRVRGTNGIGSSFGFSNEVGPVP